MKKMKKFGLWLSASLMTMPMVALADAPNTIKTKGTITTVDKLWTDVIEKGFNWFLSFVILFGAAMIIWGGYLYMTGKPEDGRKQLTYGIVGVIIAAGAWTIIAIVKTFVGL